MCVYMVPCPVFPPPPPPHGMGGGYDAPVVVYIHTYIPTYLPTYLHTYVHTYIHTITLPYLTLPYLTLHYLTLHSIHTYIPYHYITLPYITLPYLTLPYLTFHTYIHTNIHTNIPTYQHTNIPTYQHTNIPPPQATGGGPEEPYHHHRPQGGGTRRTIPPPQATGGGDQKNQTILSTHTHWWGGEGGWPTLHHIYIHTETWYNLSGKSSTGCQQNDKIWWYQPQRQSSSRYPKMGILLVVIFVDSLIFAAKNFKHVRACPTPRGIITLYFPGYNKQRPLTALTTCGRALLEDQRFLSVYRRMRLRS